MIDEEVFYWDLVTDGNLTSSLVVCTVYLNPEYEQASNVWYMYVNETEPGTYVLIADYVPRESWMTPFITFVLEVDIDAEPGTNAVIEIKFGTGAV